MGPIYFWPLSFHLQIMVFDLALRDGVSEAKAKDSFVIECVSRQILWTMAWIIFVLQFTTVVCIRLGIYFVLIKN